MFAMQTDMLEQKKERWKGSEIHYQALKVWSKIVKSQEPRTENAIHKEREAPLRRQAAKQNASLASPRQHLSKPHDHSQSI